MKTVKKITTVKKQKKDSILKIRSIRNPIFKKLVKRGRGARKFPNELLIGFELETVLKGKKSYYSGNIDLGKYRNLKKMFYAKDDCSIEANYSDSDNWRGVEFNSHPFNWNWLLSNKKYLYDLGRFLENTKSYCNRTCGFHVHLSKRYFTDKSHIYRFLYMFYRNPNYIQKISKRGNISNLEEYANPRLDSIGGRVTLKEISSDFEYMHRGEKYIAVNIYHKDTVEVRIFQSTINPLLFTAYLEFCVALAIYTKSPNHDLKIDSFKEYVHRNRLKYPNLNQTKLLDKPSHTSYKSSVSDISRGNFWSKFIKKNVKRNTKKYLLTA